MNTLTLLAFIAAPWLSYPIAGVAITRAEVAEGKRPQGAGFSFLPELMVFPLCFFAAAKLIDLFLASWGIWFVAGVCVAFLAMNIFAVVRSAVRLSRASKMSRVD